MWSGVERKRGGGRRAEKEQCVRVDNICICLSTQRAYLQRLFMGTEVSEGAARSMEHGARSNTSGRRRRHVLVETDTYDIINK